MEEEPFIPAAKQKAYVRQQLGTSEDALRDAITQLREWLCSQPHLPNGLDDGHIERMYINCKCDMGRTKKALDSYFSLKNVFPELLMNRDPLASEIRRSTENVTFFGIPKLTPDGYRVVVVTFTNNVNETDPLAVCKHVMIASETMLALDYALGTIVIVDLKHLSMPHILAFGTGIVRKTIMIYTTVYNRSVKSIHLVNAPSLVDKLIAVAKIIMPAKLVRRIKVHAASKDSIREHVLPAFVPNELGGTAGSYKELMEVSLETMASLRDWFLRQDELVSDESKRPRKQSKVELFRKLSID